MLKRREESPVHEAQLEASVAKAKRCRLELRDDSPTPDGLGCTAPQLQTSGTVEGASDFEPFEGGAVAPVTPPIKGTGVPGSSRHTTLVGAAGGVGSSDADEDEQAARLVHHRPAAEVASE